MEIVQKLITPNKFSRPGIALSKIKGLVIHYVANPMSTALANRNFFEDRKMGATGYGSAHFIVGLKGEIIQCIPENEVAYHAGADVYKPEAIRKFGTWPNKTTIGIEMTHIDAAGRPNAEILKGTIDLCIYLCKKYKLDPLQSILRHFDVTGKICPKWYIDNPSEWTKLLQIIKEGVEKK